MSAASSPIVAASSQRFFVGKATTPIPWGSVRARGRRRQFCDATFSHTPDVHERLDYQYGPWLKEANPVDEEWGPEVTEEEAANAVASIEDVEMAENAVVVPKIEESGDEDEGYESESESEEDDPKDQDYVPGRKGDWCREKGQHTIVRARR